MALFGTVATVRAQLAHSAPILASFDYLDECLRAGSDAQRLLARLLPGQTERVDLAGGAFALVQSYVTKPREEGRWETHVAYVDLQVVFEGRERMEVADRGRLRVVEDLTPGRDVIFYSAFEEGSVLNFGPGDAAVYYPVDAHRGALAWGEPAVVRKVVVKIPVAG